MTIFRLTRPKESIMTMKFATYNAAIAFARGSGLLNPSKPYKRTLHIDGDIKIVWCVTMPQVKFCSAQYERIAA